MLDYLVFNFTLTLQNHTIIEPAEGWEHIIHKHTEIEGDRGPAGSHVACTNDPALQAWEARDRAVGSFPLSLQTVTLL